MSEFWHCSHCKKVVQPSETELDRLEDSPNAIIGAVLKCPDCHNVSVKLKEPATRRPLSPERAAEREAIAGTVTPYVKIDAAGWFQKMRDAVAAAPDPIPLCK